MSDATESRMARCAAMSPFEADVVSLLVDLARIFGAPKSLGALYGLIFASPGPISFEQIAARLRISAGSISQGLKVLRSIGAVKTTFVAGDRRDYYVAETQFRRLAANFIQHHLGGHLAESEGRLTEIIQQRLASANAKSGTDTVRERLETLLRWHQRAREAAPALLRMLDV